MPLERYLGIVFSLPFIILFLVAIFHLILKLIRDRHAPVKTVGAVVIDKHKIEQVSKYSGTGKTEKYVVVFLADGKKKLFTFLRSLTTDIASKRKAFSLIEATPSSGSNDAYGELFRVSRHNDHSKNGVSPRETNPVQVLLATGLFF